MTKVFSWGRAHPCDGELLPYKHNWEFEAKRQYLPTGLFRSYGDSCLLSQQTMIDMTALDHFLAFDAQSGILELEAGVSLEQILTYFVPRGYFLPVSPGTKFVTVGGAIANDIHGKNHHQAGTFGQFVESFELLRSEGSVIRCCANENADLFQATIGGLGLTGIILSARLRLKRVQSAYIDVEFIRFQGLDEYVQINGQSAEKYEYTVAWLDCLSKNKNGNSSARGIYMRGNHAKDSNLGLKVHDLGKLSVPFDLPSATVNTYTMKAFNTMYFHRLLADRKSMVQHYDAFFYPLDGIHHWNRVYGRKGFYQYQCVVPEKDNQYSLQGILDDIAQAGQGSFLTVLKTFGGIRSPGMLSFPMPGLTLCVDFAARGPKTFALMDELDRRVRKAGGRTYAAKDGRITPSDFLSGYPEWNRFKAYRDPALTSDFAKRVLNDKN